MSHDTTIQGERSSLQPTTALHFSLLQDCIVIPANITLTFKDVVLGSSVLDGLNNVLYQHLLPFVEVQAGGSVVLQHVLYKNAMKLTASSLMNSIMQTPRMEHSGRPGETCQEALDKGEEWCRQFAEENCGGIKECEEVGSQAYMKYII